MWFGEPHPFPERGSPTLLSTSGQQRYEGWWCRSFFFNTLRNLCVFKVIWWQTLIALAFDSEVTCYCKGREVWFVKFEFAEDFRSSEMLRLIFEWVIPSVSYDYGALHLHGQQYNTTVFYAPLDLIVEYISILRNIWIHLPKRRTSYKTSILSSQIAFSDSIFHGKKFS
jgi:hypothetical protein